MEKVTEKREFAVLDGKSADGNSGMWGTRAAIEERCAGGYSAEAKDMHSMSGGQTEDGA